MKLAVTGASGFLGRAFVPAALARGHAVRVLLRRHSSPPVAGAETVQGDLDDPAAIALLITGADALVHLAAAGVQGRDRDRSRMMAANVLAVAGLVAQSRSVSRAVLAGTCLEYRGHGELPGAPADVAGPLLGEDSSLDASDAYGATKAAGGIVARSLARELGVPTWYLRMASLYGAGDDGEKLVPAALAAARVGREMALGPGEAVREWLHVSDAVEALLLACERAPEGVEVVNIGTGRGVTVRDLARQVFIAAGADPELVRPGMRPARREAHVIVMDPDRALSRLGWKPKVELEAGLAELARSEPRG